MLILFLDDSERRVQVATDFFEGKQFEGVILCVAMNAHVAIEYLRLAEEPWDLVMLDHDLGEQVYQNSDEENCGMEVVRYIERTRPEVKKIVVHSWNVPAGREMQIRLQQAGYDTAYQPFEG